MKPPSTLLHYLSMRDELGRLMTAMKLTGKMVEVGTLFGAYAEVILRTWPGHLTCVDPWRNQDEAVYFDGANKHNMNRVWDQVNQILGKNPRCTLIRDYSLNAVTRFRDEELDGVYLDGNHALPNARGDINAWWPKVKIGGVFGGHDFFCRYDKDTNSDAQTAVMELAERIGQWPHVTWDTSWWFVKTAEADRLFRGETYDIDPPMTNENIDLVVVLAVSLYDLHLAKKWLTWAAFLSAQKPTPYDLVIWCAKAIPEETVKKLGEFAAQDDMRVTVATTPEVYEKGYAPSANYLFRTALEYCETAFPGRAMLWCEADTVPMCPSWVNEIRDEYRKCNRPFMGDALIHPPGVSGTDHMTGNAVYSPQWRKYAPSLALLPEPRPEQGWDSLCAHETFRQMARATTIQQIWRPKPFPEQFEIQKINASTALFHQCKDGTLIDVLALQAGCPAIGLEPAPIRPPAPRVMSSSKSQVNVVEPEGPKMEILIVTCRRDMEFLRYAMKSIPMFAANFSGVTVCVPHVEATQYSWMPKGTKLVTFQEQPGKGFLQHLIMKCRADEICPKADYILHLDPDCMLIGGVTPGDYLKDGRPMIVRERYAVCGARNENRLRWRGTVTEATGIIPEWECMVRHPQVYHRSLYSKTREMVEMHTLQPFDEYVLHQRNAFPQGFCEFNTLGAIAVEYFAPDYWFIDYDRDQDAKECGVDPKTAWQYIYRPGRDKLVEFYSHAGIEAYRQQAEDIMHGKHQPFYVK